MHFRNLIKFYKVLNTHCAKEGEIDFKAGLLVLGVSLGVLVASLVAYGGSSAFRKPANSTHTQFSDGTKLEILTTGNQNTIKIQDEAAGVICYGMRHSREATGTSISCVKVGK